MTLEAIKFTNNQLSVLNQLKLPLETEYLEIHTTEDAHDAIKRMVVRGAPAIAIVGMLGVAVDVLNNAKDDSLADYASCKLDFIVTARPTAVNLANAVAEFKRLVSRSSMTRTLLVDAAVAMYEQDLAANKQLGKCGVDWIAEHLGPEPVGVLTICNTGSLATAGFGTALGIVRSLHQAQRLKRVYALETRPYNQGARLTAFELVHDQIPATLVTDSMAASLLRQHPEIRVVVVGADRVAANGDTANKIGTYQLAVLARHFGVKFIVAAPTTTLDSTTPSGEDIPIELRPPQELTQLNGVQIAAPGVDVWNPAFDVTPYELIDAIVTERGVWRPQ